MHSIAIVVVFKSFAPYMYQSKEDHTDILVSDEHLDLSACMRMDVDVPLTTYEINGETHTFSF